MLPKALDHVTDEQLAADYPLLVFQEKTTTMFFLLHLSTPFVPIIWGR
jgi:hypothetical protein